eukprot:7106023-Alexandrium_andersonii.AAC.2
MGHVHDAMSELRSERDSVHCMAKRRLDSMAWMRALRQIFASRGSSYREFGMSCDVWGMSCGSQAAVHGESRARLHRSVGASCARGYAVSSCVVGRF